jgi:signal transduction histidine kinase
MSSAAQSLRPPGAATHSLRRRMVAAFAMFALASAVLFGALGVLFVYTVEDSFFANMLAQEVAQQQRSWREQARLAAPLRAGTSLHRTPATFPPDLARRMPDGAARAGEFAGEQGRHYHVARTTLAGTDAPLFIVAEVSRELVVRPRLAGILSFLGWTALAMLAATLVLGYWLARRATQPLAKLANLLGGAVPARLPQGFAKDFPDNEIGLLAHRLDEALERTADFITREQNFTRDASHELRTPLAVIEGAAQLLAQQPLDALGAAQLQRIRSAAAQMEQAVTTLLSLAREDEMTSREPVELLPLVEETVVRFAHLLDGKPVTVDVELAAGLVVACHRGALTILLANVVSNAFGHTSAGVIRIHMENGALVVADSGPGIAEPLRARIFDSGIKGDGSAGFGFGLSIVKRLGERAGIAVTIEHPATGTRALLRF